jgi:hypothetical protein
VHRHRPVGTPVFAVPARLSNVQARWSTASMSYTRNVEVLATSGLKTADYRQHRTLTGLPQRITTSSTRVPTTSYSNAAEAPPTNPKRSRGRGNHWLITDDLPAAWVRRLYGPSLQLPVHSRLDALKKAEALRDHITVRRDHWSRKHARRGC